MGEARHKLKGCRPSAEVIQEYSNVSARLGDIIFQIDRSHHEKHTILKRQRELMLEMSAAQAQEKQKEAPPEAFVPQPEEVIAEVVNG